MINDLAAGPCLSVALQVMSGVGLRLAPNTVLHLFVA